MQLLRLAVSLGGSETLICHPASTTHYAVARDRLAEAGITVRCLQSPDGSLAEGEEDSLIAVVGKAY